jgi:hypothetical protein
MTMYTQLIGLALEGGAPRPTGDQSLIGGSLAEAMVCRIRMLARIWGGSPEQSFTDQLAYDIALVHLADRLGVEWALHQFDQPARGRRALERALSERGVRWPSGWRVGPE